jgi:hypothetical protein
VLSEPLDPLKLGLRLAHAAEAFSKAVRSEAGMVGRVLPLEGGVPPAPGLKSPGENDTPWLFRQFSYAVNDAVPEPAVVVLEPDALEGLLLQAASSTPSTPINGTNVAARTQRFIDRRFIDRCFIDRCFIDCCFIDRRFIGTGVSREPRNLATTCNMRLTLEPSPEGPLCRSCGFHMKRRHFCMNASEIPSLVRLHVKSITKRREKEPSQGPSGPSQGPSQGDGLALCRRPISTVHNQVGASRILEVG